MFLPNDVIEYLDAPGRPLRILWIDPAGAQAYTYALGIPGAVPRPTSLRDLYTALRERRAPAAARSLARRQPRGHPVR